MNERICVLGFVRVNFEVEIISGGVVGNLWGCSCWKVVKYVELLKVV